MSASAAVAWRGISVYRVKEYIINIAFLFMLLIQTFIRIFHRSASTPPPPPYLPPPHLLTTPRPHAATHRTHTEHTLNTFRISGSIQHLAQFRLGKLNHANYAFVLSPENALIIILGEWLVSGLSPRDAHGSAASSVPSLLWYAAPLQHTRLHKARIH